MDREQIIALAREAGMEQEFHGVFPSMERFTALVAAHEREECAKVCDDLERKKWETLTQGGKLSGFGAIDCAAAIRSRHER